VIPDSYGVLFRETYTLEEHFAFIGQNLSESARCFDHIRLINAYHVYLDNYTLHEIVRRDPGVELVEHHAYHNIAGMIESTDFEDLLARKDNEEEPEKKRYW
jgi:hypothetical protein